MEAVVVALRAECRDLERRLRQKKRALHEAEKHWFRECSHEWVKAEENSFLSSYCPDSCSKCGFLRLGPVKMP
jgi:hypothetical protein